MHAQSVYWYVNKGELGMGGSGQGRLLERGDISAWC